MKNLVLVAIAIAALTISACGGGGGGGGSDLSCAPSTASDPTYDLSGTWTLVISPTTDCEVAITLITCTLTITQTAGESSVSASGTCINNIGVTTNISSMSGLLYGSTLYWGGSQTGSFETDAGLYTETDTIACTDAPFVSESLSSTFDGTISVSWSLGSESGSCSGTFDAIFTKTS
jgi:hypothetical protein